LGAQLRAERQQRSLSVRELARRVGLSASLISQVETGRVQPSVTTLMAVVTELGLSLDNLFSESLQAGVDAAAAAWPAEQKGGADDVPSSLLPAVDGASWSKSGQRPALEGPWVALGVERAGKRAFLELESGVRWERLTPYSLPGIEFLYVHYGAGASSTANGKHTRHQGIEFGYVTTGTINVTVGFDETVLAQGDSIMFDAATPHRLENKCDVPAEAVWLIMGRQSLAVPPSQQD
jgi:transcriptional regulator with XRE-family HTH domain/mannose-6-phosphate isomerase-like protein (cupin superfamily)